MALCHGREAISVTEPRPLNKKSTRREVGAFGATTGTWTGTGKWKAEGTEVPGAGKDTILSL